MKAKLYTDGGARGNPGPAGIGAILFAEEGQLLAIDAKYKGEITNNQAEYQGLILGLEMAINTGVNELEVYMDSELVVKQLNGEYKIKDEKIKPLATEAKGMLEKFEQYTISHVRREHNKFADKLVNIVLDARS